MTDMDDYLDKFDGGITDVTPCIQVSPEQWTCNKCGVFSPSTRYGIYASEVDKKDSETTFCMHCLIAYINKLVQNGDIGVGE